MKIDMMSVMCPINTFVLILHKVQSIVFFSKTILEKIRYSDVSVLFTICIVHKTILWTIQIVNNTDTSE